MTSHNATAGEYVANILLALCLPLVFWAQGTVRHTRKWAVAAVAVGWAGIVTATAIARSEAWITELCLQVAMGACAGVVVYVLQHPVRSQPATLVTPKQTHLVTALLVLRAGLVASLMGVMIHARHFPLVVLGGIWGSMAFLAWVAHIFLFVRRHERARDVRVLATMFECLFLVATPFSDGRY